jgi:outer membrane murein-binding lipoprotein Lpp
LQRETKARGVEAVELRGELEDNKAEINDLSDKNRKAAEIIDAMTEENDGLRNDIDHLHNATINITNFSEEIHTLKRKIEDIIRDINHMETQIGAAQSELSRQERELEDKKRKVKELAAEGNIPAQPIPSPRPQYQQSSQPQYFTHKTSGSVHSESTEEEKNHVIKVLEHESKLYHFEKNFLKMMSQNQAQPGAQALKPAPFRASIPIYDVNENRPF